MKRKNRPRPLRPSTLLPALLALASLSTRCNSESSRTGASGREALEFGASLERLASGAVFLDAVRSDPSREPIEIEQDVMAGLRVHLAAFHDLPLRTQAEVVAGMERTGIPGVDTTGASRDERARFDELVRWFGQNRRPILLLYTQAVTASTALLRERREQTFIELSGENLFSGALTNDLLADQRALLREDDDAALKRLAATLRDLLDDFHDRFLQSTLEEQLYAIQEWGKTLRQGRPAYFRADSPFPEPSRRAAFCRELGERTDLMLLAMLDVAARAGEPSPALSELMDRAALEHIELAARVEWADANRDVIAGATRSDGTPPAPGELDRSRLQEREFTELVASYRATFAKHWHSEAGFVASRVAALAPDERSRIECFRLLQDIRASSLLDAPAVPGPRKEDPR